MVFDFVKLHKRLWGVGYFSHTLLTAYAVLRHTFTIVQISVVVEVDLIVGGFVVTKMHSFGYIGFRCCWQVLVDRRIWAKRKGCEAFASQPFLSHM